MDVKERIEEIKKRVSHDEDVLFLVENFVETCNTYVSIVVHMENSIGAARFRLDHEAFKSFVTSLDRRRKATHDALMSSVRVVNRIEKVFHGDMGDRKEVGDFAKDVVNAYFERRVG